MSSVQKLEQYLGAVLLTNVLSFEEFKRLVEVKSPTTSTELIEQWYTKYVEQDQVLRQAIQNESKEFVTKIRQKQMLELEQMQLAETFSLEKVINDLYTVDEILAARLQLVDAQLAQETEALKGYNGTVSASLEQRKSHKGDTNWPSISSLFAQIEEYRRMVDERNDI